MLIRIINNKPSYDTRYAQGSLLWSTAHMHNNHFLSESSHVDQISVTYSLMN